VSKKGTQVLEEALTLPAAERAQLANRLLESLDVASDRKIDQLWAQEAEDRVDAFERGEIKSVSIREVFSRTDNMKR